MRVSSLYPALGAVLLVFAQSSSAQSASVTITSPMDGAKLDAMTEHPLVYEIVPGPKGDHSHLYVDNKEQAVLRQLKGTHTLKTLSPGLHDICIRVVNKGHTPIGVERCVQVTVR